MNDNTDRTIRRNYNLSQQYITSYDKQVMERVVYAADDLTHGTKSKEKKRSLREVFDFSRTYSLRQKRYKHTINDIIKTLGVRYINIIRSSWKSNYVTHERYAVFDQPNHNDNVLKSYFIAPESTDVYWKSLLRDIIQYISFITITCEIECDCLLIISAIYIQRLFQNTNKELKLNIKNWKSIILLSIILSNKNV
jgi:hypothetical protein